jgi:precorrin-4 methylase
MKRPVLTLVFGVSFVLLFCIAAFAGGRFYVIGLGPAGPEFLSRQAAELIQEVDALIVGEDLGPRFKRFLTGKKILFNPYNYHYSNFAAHYPDWPKSKIKKELEAARAQRADQVLGIMQKGGDVAYLAAGDPNIFGSWQHWIKKFIPRDKLQVIPGISSFNAAASVLKNNLFCRSSVVLATPETVMENESLVSVLARGKDTMALFMALQNPAKYMAVLNKHYGPSTPVSVVYFAGYPDKERVVKTTLARAVATLKAEPEKYMGIVFVGPCLAAD